MVGLVAVAQIALWLTAFVPFPRVVVVALALSALVAARLQDVLVHVVVLVLLLAKLVAKMVKYLSLEVLAAPQYAHLLKVGTALLAKVKKVKPRLSPSP